MNSDGSNGQQAAPAETVRQLTDVDALALAELVEVFEDLQTLLRCCERLVTELEGAADEVVVEALWTTALLCYARCFTGTGDGVALTEDDVASTHSAADKVVEWHRLLLRLRDHHAEPATNPRERFSVGVAQSPDGTAEGLAITSARQPLVDLLTVRQTGAIGYALSGLVNGRIEARQQQVFDGLKDRSKEELNTLDVLEISTVPNATAS